MSKESEDKKITRADAKERVKEGEELLFVTCPCCQTMLALYLTATRWDVSEETLN